jgi:formate dehydrogenase beta subunit
MKALLAEGYDAVFVGCGAPRGRDLDVPGRRRPRPTSTSASTGWRRCRSATSPSRQARHRAGRRQHRDGLLPLGAPPGRRRREGGRALRLRGDEGLALGEGRRPARRHPDPQLPRAQGLPARGGKLVRHALRDRQGAVYDDKGRAAWCPPASPTWTIECDEVLVAVGQENAFPWIERDMRHRVRQVGPAGAGREDAASRRCPKVFFGGDAAFGPKNIITAVAHGHEAAVSIDRFCTART